MDGCLNWLFPPAVKRTAIPNALIVITESDPINEHIVTYTITLVLPHRGTTFHIIPAVINITRTK